VQVCGAGAVGRGEGVGSREHLGIGGGGGMLEDTDGVEAGAGLVVLLAVQGFSQVSPVLDSILMHCRSVPRPGMRELLFCIQWLSSASCALPCSA
jgi:hypothetical protein